MGSVNVKSTSDVVMPEILSYSHGEVLLLHGNEAGKSFWWPPGAYWIAEKACDLNNEEPVAWVRRVLESQIHVNPSEVRLRSVEFISKEHLPVLVYEAQLIDEPRPSAKYGFDQARYFPLSALPENLGRDMAHSHWLRNLLNKGQAISA